RATTVSRRGAVRRTARPHQLPHPGGPHGAPAAGGRPRRGALPGPAEHATAPRRPRVSGERRPRLEHSGRAHDVPGADSRRGRAAHLTADGSRGDWRPSFPIREEEGMVRVKAVVPVVLTVLSLVAPARRDQVAWAAEG